ncbi:hypothetical protein GWC77_24040 [Paraburkholderia sp. NMBU_R16]|uniref:hypothetical protein n=1 Tax=Paraburkholderia sp. NMBU_R16 TaxID=2698676 RepID=UPI001567B812|nr:hypothetical protein [Paraburkholderia sp. NMBU_R16]NRO98981.1 hypothetical protein [Paraburkholderia sp. NMBU_R16]
MRDVSGAVDTNTALRVHHFLGRLENEKVGEHRFLDHFRNKTVRAQRLDRVRQAACREVLRLIPSIHPRDLPDILIRVAASLRNVKAPSARAQTAKELYTLVTTQRPCTGRIAYAASLLEVADLPEDERVQSFNNVLGLYEHVMPRSDKMCQLEKKDRRGSHFVSARRYAIESARRQLASIPSTAQEAANDRLGAIEARWDREWTAARDRYVDAIRGGASAEQLIDEGGWTADPEMVEALQLAKRQ